MMPKVVIFQYRLFHYRVDLFNLMRRLAAERGIELVVVAGQAFGKEIPKRDEGTLGWECRVKSLYFPIEEKKDLCWQPWPKQHRDARLLDIHAGESAAGKLLVDHPTSARSRACSRFLGAWPRLSYACARRLP